jgi:hypothetical protein
MLTWWGYVCRMDDDLQDDIPLTKLDESLLGSDSLYVELKAKLTGLRTEVRELEAALAVVQGSIRSALGESKIGVLPNGVIYQLQTRCRGGYSVDATTITVLQRVADRVPPKGQ